MRDGRWERVEVFEYPAGPEPQYPSWDGLASPLRETGSGSAQEIFRRGESGFAKDDSSPQFERKIAEEAGRSFEAGRLRGNQEGRLAEREAQGAAFVAAEQRRVGQVAAIVADFARERDRYLNAVEHEVVDLALAVAARILRREAQMDPLLLTGAVRVALGQLSNSTEVELRVPAAELDLWAEAIALVPNLALKPTVIAGEGMRLGDCAIATRLGTVDLGIRTQLGEIERGFFDRAGRPAAAADRGRKTGVQEARV